MPDPVLLPGFAEPVSWQRAGRSLLLLPHLLSLDAVAVALAWQALLAYDTGLLLGVSERAVLAVTVWFIYIGDRLLDVRGTESAPSSARHRFYWQHRKLSIGLLAGAGFVDALLIFAAVPQSILPGGLLLAAAVMVYLTAAQLAPFGQGITKALWVAALFVAGTFLVAWTEAKDPMAGLWRPALAFFALCLANLVLIDIWEDEDPSGRPGRMTSATRRAFPVFTVLLAACCAAPEQPWYRAVAVSAVLLLVLFGIGRRMSLDARRALVDLALLTPLPFLLR